ncbi:hypothetical protein K443DRAFT_683985 [Laccaria amethystina LaAM-08-1]|uniref:Uncharacterized protein n=1 Tax=Laccaria amethystina LaAM-08-1 TaxID=1095629 RepID=A0A0C9X933_9AGAR|nr:hypothetical protein K443DRAFT_683985 [Laccaria amethystina LaAM-08-1]
MAPNVQRKGYVPGEYPCQLIHLTAQVSERHPAVNAVKTAWTHHPTPRQKPRKPLRMPNRPKRRPGRPLRMRTAHPTSPLAPPLVVVEGCGRTQNCRRRRPNTDVLS